MNSALEFRLSALKHGYTKQDADTVIYGPLTKIFEQGPGQLGWRVCFVGFTNSAELIEVLVEYLDDGREICFHMDKVSKELRKQYERRT